MRCAKIFPPNIALQFLAKMFCQKFPPILAFQIRIIGKILIFEYRDLQSSSLLGESFKSFLNIEMFFSSSVKRDERDTDRDCGKQTCSLEIRFLPSCTLYGDESSEETCNYPCSLDHCVPEIHHFIQCPIWSCFDKTTTVQPPDSTTSTPPSSHSECSTLCISSISFNAIMILIVAIMTVFLKKHFCHRTQETSFENALFNQTFDAFSNEPIIRRSGSRFSEHIPLLRVDVGDGRNSLERPGSNLGRDRDARSGRSSSTSIPLTPPASAPPMSYSESAPTLHFAENTF